MKAAFVFFSLLLCLAPILRAEITDLPQPGDEFPQPLPPDPPGTEPGPKPPQQPGPNPVPGRIVVGDYVLSGPYVGKQYYTGRVVQVSGDGRSINVRDDRDQRVYQRDARLISKRMRCGARSICENDRVRVGPINSQYYYATVHSAYERGLFVVRYDQDGRYYVRDQSKVQKFP
ncbi:hypothetical protein ACLVWU_13375 [Bdellovibrio sp. HCB290]|uniref:hypothetical protein n=1 Tax=Bdellovibrio sp. HCB290 TaxID=3394356 RepID=UPI0039B6C862